MRWLDRPLALGILGGLCLLLVAGCVTKPEKEQQRPLAFQQVPAPAMPSFRDDLELRGLRKAVERSLDFYRRVPKERVYPLGNLEVSAGSLAESLELFLDLMERGPITARTVSEHFDVYCLDGSAEPPRMLVTGYYEPVIEADLESDEIYRYPLYAMPPDLITVNLASFDPVRYSGRKIVGRLVEHRLVPYYSRADIDGKGVLEGCECRLAWLKDPVDAFFLHVQGSGVLSMPDGTLRRVGYAAANGRPYRSIGRYLIEKGAVGKEEMSLQAIRKYLQQHPRELDQVLWHNESYVFFRWVDEGPVGSLNVPLVAGRSVATDPQFYPRGVLGYLVSTMPVPDEHGQVAEWRPFGRWVLNQDTGGAIKGPKKLDLFCGTGETAGWIAGRMKQTGSFYILLKKQLRESRLERDRAELPAARPPPDLSRELSERNRESRRSS